MCLVLSVASCNKKGKEPDIQQEWRTTGGLNTTQNGNKGEQRDQGDNQVQDDKTT